MFRCIFTRHRCCSCNCRGITEEQIVEAIKNGASSFEEVKEETGAGAGGCRGGRCKCNIELLIENNK